MTDSKLSLDFDKEQELWKPIPGYEGVYSASTLGRIRREKPYSTVFRGQIRIQSVNRKGYLYIGLSTGNVSVFYSVHKLVCLTFLGPRPDGYQINHKDAVKTNNRLENLEYVTPLENTHHTIAIGHAVLKLTDEQVLEIRAKYMPRIYGYALLAREYNVSPTLIWNVVKRKQRIYV